MKAFKFYIISLLAVSLAAPMGCGDGDPAAPEDRSTDSNNDGPDGGTEVGEVEDVASLDECVPSLTCAGLENPADCVATFELGTTQAGYEGDYGPVGFYTYTDKTEDGQVSPPINNYDSEDAELVRSCGEYDNYVHHFHGSGFTEWGAGIGMDWSGRHNDSCNPDPETGAEPGVNPCLDLMLEDDKLTIAELEASPECQTDGAPDQDKIDCAKYTTRYKETRDLSDYVGVGFWIARTDESTASIIKMTFPIPDTTRFGIKAFDDNGEPSEFGACSEDDGDGATACFNDFATTVRLANTEVGKWVFKYVLFKDLVIDQYWGLQLNIPEFPAEESIGIKFQVAQNQTFDFYIDDIILLREEPSI